jgi:hypothetical protein
MNTKEMCWLHNRSYSSDRNCPECEQQDRAIRESALELDYPPTEEEGSVIIGFLQWCGLFLLLSIIVFVVLALFSASGK